MIRRTGPQPVRHSPIPMPRPEPPRRLIDDPPPRPPARQASKIAGSGATSSGFPRVLVMDVRGDESHRSGASILHPVRARPVLGKDLYGVKFLSGAVVMMIGQHAR